MLQTGSWAQNLPAGKSAAEGFPMSIASGTQGNIGKLGIGADYMGGGPYIDEKGARRNGLHASLSIAVDDAPKLFSQPDVHEGQALMIAGYRILVEKIVSGPSATGTVLLRVWLPPKPVKTRTWRRFFGL
jgi:hypothetical protein